MTFVNDPSDKIRLRTNQPSNNQNNRQPQAPQQPPNTVAVGFWADMPTYRKYQAYANKLYNQIVTDEQGKERRLLERNDVNEFIYFATEYFISVTDWTTKIQNSGDFMGVIKNLVKQIGTIH